MEIFQRALMQRGVEEEDLGKMTEAAGSVERQPKPQGIQFFWGVEMMGRRQLSQPFFGVGVQQPQ